MTQNSGIIFTTQVVASGVTSTAIANSINAEPLFTALITFGVSIVTIVGTELIKFLVAYLQKKTNDLNSKKKEGKK